MKRAHVIIGVVGFIAVAAIVPAFGDDWPQWRGPHRDGNSGETGLLKQWPKEGPKLLWQSKEAGSGYSTPVVAGERLYLLGNEGLENEFVRALSAKDGKTCWTTKLGKVGNPNQKPNYPAARSTPTLDRQMLYALGSDGDLACLETATGKIVWHKNLRADFGGKAGTWAYAESPLVDGEAVVCTPGGSEATLVALNKKTGEVLWKTAVPGGDPAAYASILMLNAAGVKQYVQLLQKGLVGIEAKSGKFLWRYEKPVSKYNANIPTPVAYKDYVYAASAGTGAGVIQVKGQEGAIQPEQVYFSPKLPTAIGGAIVVDGLLFGTTGQAMLCVDFLTGNVKWEERALGPASLCYAEGRLYLHGENGEVALVEATATGYHELGRFAPPGQPKHADEMEKAWAFPVVSNGRLYIRDHASLWCYDVWAGY